MFPERSPRDPATVGNDDVTSHVLCQLSSPGAAGQGDGPQLFADTHGFGGAQRTVRTGSGDGIVGSTARRASTLGFSVTAHTEQRTNSPRVAYGKSGMKNSVNQLRAR